MKNPNSTLKKKSQKPSKGKEKKINLFSREGLQRQFPTAKIVRKKDKWEVRFPLPKDYKTLRNLDL